MKRSQAAQDTWVETMTKGKQNGFFVEVGAYDGLLSSNTAYFEEDLGWRGICIEANPDLFATLMQNRPGSHCLSYAVTNITGHVHFAGDKLISEGGITVPADTLTNLLDGCGAPTSIDYMSVDIEGSEYAALSVFDFDKYKVSLLTVEHNLYCEGPVAKDQMFDLLTSKGFVRVVEDAPCLDPSWWMQPYEDWYAHADFLQGA